jgi:hypothetical protein
LKLLNTGCPVRFLRERLLHYEASGKAGNGDAFFNAALICFKDLSDTHRSVPYLEQGIAEGNLRSGTMLGQLIVANQVHGSKRRAVALLKRSADAGDRSAIVLLPHAEKAAESEAAF